MPRLSRKEYEKILGVKLEDDEVVHHKDHDIENNDDKNLVVLTKTEHKIYHFKGKNAMYKYRIKQRQKNQE